MQSKNLGVSKISLVVFAGFVAILWMGCSTKVVKKEDLTLVATEIPTVLSTATPTLVPTAEPKLSTYKVKKMDSLWRIAEKKSVYGNPWHWPLLYKTNRDEISDPNLIYPGQNLRYLKSGLLDSESRQSAEQEAQDAKWPIYKRTK